MIYSPFDLGSLLISIVRALMRPILIYTYIREINIKGNKLSIKNIWMLIAAIELVLGLIWTGYLYLVGQGSPFS